MKKNHITLLLMLLCSTMCRAQQSDIELFKQYLGSKEARFVIPQLLENYNEVCSRTQNLEYKIHFGGSLPDQEFRDLVSTVKDIKDRLTSTTDKSIAFSKDATIKKIDKFRSKAKLLPTFYDIIDKKFNGNTERYVNDMLEKSVFLNDKSYNRFKEKSGIKRLEKDPYMNYLVSQAQYVDMLETFNITGAKWANLKKITCNGIAFDKIYPLMSAIYSVLAKTTPDFIYGTTTSFAYPRQNYLSNHFYYNLKQDKLTKKMIEKALNEYIAENPISKDERERLIASVKGNPKYSNIVNSKFDYSAEKYVDHLLSKSILTNANERAKFLKNPSKKKIVNDPGVNYTLTKIKKMK